MPTPPPSANYTITPDGTGRALLVCAVVFAAAAAVAVGLRLGMRVRDRMVGWDDGLMALGLVFHIALASVAAFGTFRGLGAEPGVLPRGIVRALYAAVLVTVKTAVCLLLLRIASAVRLYRRCILGALAVTFAAFVATEVGALGKCRPIAANWKDGLPGATCSSDYASVAVAAVATLVSVATDWFCALFPLVMVWRMPMPRASKVAVAGVLGLGVLASVCPLVRVRYVLEYARMIGRVEHGKRHRGPKLIGSLILWSVLECGIGLVAASLPAIWHGCRKWRRHSRLLGADAAHNRDMVAEQLAMQDHRGLKPRTEGTTSSQGLLDGAKHPPANAQPVV